MWGWGGWGLFWKRLSLSSVQEQRKLSIPLCSWLKDFITTKTFLFFFLTIVRSCGRPFHWLQCFWKKAHEKSSSRGSGQWQVKWWVKGGTERGTGRLKPWHITTLPCCELWEVFLHWCTHTMPFPTHTAIELSVSFIPSSHPESHCVFASSVKRRKVIWVLRHFPDFTPALCCLVHPSSLTQCIPGLYRWLPLCHSCSRVMAIRAISLSSIPVYVNMATACCKHTIQLRNNVI